MRQENRRALVKNRIAVGNPNAGASVSYYKGTQRRCSLNLAAENPCARQRRAAIRPRWRLSQITQLRLRTRLADKNTKSEKPHSCHPPESFFHFDLSFEFPGISRLCSLLFFPCLLSYSLYSRRAWLM